MVCGGRAPPYGGGPPPALGGAPPHYSQSGLLPVFAPKFLEKQVFKAGRSHTSRSKLLPCFPPPRFSRQVAPTLPEANYLPVFRHQNSYRRFFWFVATQKKPPFRQVFPLCYFRGRPRFSSGVAPLNFPKQITPCVFR